MVETLARRAAAVIGEFIEWWVGELWALVPPPLRRGLSRSRQRIVLVLGARTAAVRFEAGGKSSPVGDIALDDEATAAAGLAALLDGGGLARRLVDGSAEAALRLPYDRSLSTTIKLPLAARNNLAEVVEFELDSHTPFSPAQVLFDAAIVGTDVEAGLLDVAVVLLPRATADEAVARARRLGFSPGRIDVAAPDGGAPITGNLLRSGHGGWQSADRHAVAALAATAAVLAVVAAVLPVVLAQRTESALAERFAATRQQALEVAALQKKIDDLRRNELFLIDRRQTTPTVSQLLFDTTHVLPDNTWLSSWLVSGDEVQLQGITASSSALIGILEHSKIFERSSFRSPVTQEPSGGERFNIATHVAAEKGP